MQKISSSLKSRLNVQAHRFGQLAGLRKREQLIETVQSKLDNNVTVTEVEAWLIEESLHGNARPAA